MLRQVASRCRALVAPLLLTLAIAGCGSGSQDGPLQALSAGGRPIVDGASVNIPPGRSADFTAFLFNPLKLPVRLLSASVVAVTGHRPVPRLLYVGIGTSPGMAGAATGWPLRYSPTRLLAWALIQPGQSNIIFGVTGSVAGRNYWVAGLRIGYEYKAHVRYVVAWSAAVACVTTHVRTRHFDAGPGAGERAQTIVEGMAKDQS